LNKNFVNKKKHCLACNIFTPIKAKAKHEKENKKHQEDLSMVGGGWECFTLERVLV
jgi:hypothetical protein